MADLFFEKKYWDKGLTVIGTDEVGRGCLAGPVVAAAALLPDQLRTDINYFSNSEWSLLDDSKKLTPATRKKLSKYILENAKVNIAFSTPTEIDQFNILHASMWAMRKSLAPFRSSAQVLLVDGHQSPFMKMFTDKFLADEHSKNTFQVVETIIKGDTKSLSIAAASIVAKVYRDEWMEKFETQFSGYGFAKHKGYPTSEHYNALNLLGPSEIHRRSFTLSK